MSENDATETSREHRLLICDQSCSSNPISHKAVYITSQAKSHLRCFRPWQHCASKLKTLTTEWVAAKTQNASQLPGPHHLGSAAHGKFIYLLFLLENSPTGVSSRCSKSSELFYYFQSHSLIVSLWKSLQADWGFGKRNWVPCETAKLTKYF